MKILVVEDNNEKAMAISGFLVSLGIAEEDITISHYLNLAKRFLKAGYYDLMITDINIPRHLGEEAIRDGGMILIEEIKDATRYNIPKYIIGMTSYRDVFDKHTETFNSNGWSLLIFDRSNNDWQKTLHSYINHIKSVPVADLGYSSDIIFISAIQLEHSKIKDLPIVWDAERTKIDDHTFVNKGILNLNGDDIKVYAVVLRRMGMIESALMTQKLVNFLKPRLVIMTGICAGVKGKVNLGDVILASPAWDWQSGKRKLDGEKKWFEIDPEQILVDRIITSRFEEIFSDDMLWYSLRRDFKGKSAPPSHDIKGIVAPVASGSAVLADSQIMLEIAQQNRKLCGVEMEIYGVYSAVQTSSAPKPLFFGIKSVCDYGDNSKADHFQEFCAYISAQIAFEFVRRYYPDIRSLSQKLIST